jgi:hypothetical protein
VIGEPDYCICSNAIIESVLWILVDNIKLTHTDKRLVNQEDLERTGKPQYFWVNEPDSIRLFYIPDQVWTIKGEVALKPSRTATGIEKWIYETYADVLASGAVYRLAKVPGKEWSNPELAAMHKNLYEQGVTNARIRDFRNVPLMAKQRRM